MNDVLRPAVYAINKLTQSVYYSALANATGRQPGRESNVIRLVFTSVLDLRLHAYLFPSKFLAFSLLAHVSLSFSIIFQRMCKNCLLYWPSVSGRFSMNI
jgi:hypothetical protein